MFRKAMLATCLLALMADRPSVAALAQEKPRDNPGAAERACAEVAALISQLDSDRYDVRQRAADRLEQWAANPAMAPLLAREFQRVLVMPNTSLEVRKQLQRLQPRLPKIAISPEETVTDAELDKLVSQLEDDSYGARVAAAKRLEWLAASAKLAYPIMSRLKEKLYAADLAPAARQTLEPLEQRARAAWLTSDPSTWNLPPVSTAQLNRWIDEVVAATSGSAKPSALRAQAKALRELQDVFVRDAEVPRLKDLLAARLADKNLAPAAGARLKELLDLTQPGMVAEFWQRRRHGNTQNLLIGVPSLSPGAVRPSHFDYIDDQRAHCVSGQNLKPGDYPVGVAIPHPTYEDALFHLVNLTTPRRRMAYEAQGRRPEGVRLAEISRRTLDRYLQRRSPLSARELVLLEQLDANEVSRFAGEFFLAVEDKPLAFEEGDATTLRPSRHSMVCALLASDGTRAAIPGLLHALEKKRFLPPSAAAPYDLPWMAALAIAGRDPWPEVDAWLLAQLGRDDPLVHGAAHPPGLGATAAAVLLKRYQEDPLKHGLEPVPDETFNALGLAGYRFASPRSREAVRQWWEDRKKNA